MMMMCQTLSPSLELTPKERTLHPGLQRIKEEIDYVEEHLVYLKGNARYDTAWTMYTFHKIPIDFSGDENIITAEARLKDLYREFNLLKVEHSTLIKSVSDDEVESIVSFLHNHDCDML